MHHPTDRIAHTTIFVTPVVEHWLEWEIGQWVNHKGSIRRPIALSANALTIFMTKCHTYSLISFIDNITYPWNRLHTSFSNNLINSSRPLQGNINNGMRPVRSLETRNSYMTSITYMFSINVDGWCTLCINTTHNECAGYTQCSRMSFKTLWSAHWQWNAYWLSIDHAWHVCNVTSLWNMTNVASLSMAFVVICLLPTSNRFKQRFW